MIVDNITKEFKLLIDIVRKDKISPLKVRSEAILLERSFKEEFYSTLQNLQLDKRPFYIKKSISFFENLRKRVEFSNEFIQNELKKEELTLERILSDVSSKLKSILQYDSRLHFNIAKKYANQDFDVLNIRINFAKYFMYNTLTTIITFLEGDHLQNNNKEKSKPMEKIKLNLSVDQMAILFRVLKEASIISKDTSVNQLAKLISMNFTSKGSKQNSAKSISNKYYCDDVLKYRDVASLISDMDKKIEDLIKKYEQ